MSSAGDEYNVETHSKDGKKRVHEQDDHTVQKAAEFIAGGDVKTSSGRDTTLVASKISAGNEAYVYAGNDLNLLAAQNRDHTLYDMKEKGGFGNLKLQRDEVTQVTHVGSEIKTGGNLSLVSLGDQHYQVAKLDSGKDILLDSGGAITFEGVKDLHDESHTKTNNNAAWVSAKGRGNTDETLRQTQMIAKGNIVLKAVDGLKIDIKDVSQESVSQTIDAMVKADPQLAWLKDAEARGDVDWRRVKEIHESFKYSNSGLGPASQMIIAIVMAAVVGPAALTAMSGMGTFWAASYAAVATGAATNAATSFINNGGNLGAVFKDVTSSDALAGYVISGVTAGLTAGYFDSILKTTTNPITGQVMTDLSSLEGIGRFAGNQLLQNMTSTVLGATFGQHADFGNALTGALLSTLNAAAFNAVGDFAAKQGWKDGSLEKIALHAVVGGLLTEAAGGDFKTGALAAGANEALVTQLATLVKNDSNLLSMSSQLVGIAAAAVSDGNLQEGATIAKDATNYNYLMHHEIVEMLDEQAKCASETCKAEVRERYANLDEQRNAELGSLCQKNLSACKQLSDQLLADQPKIRELAEQLRLSGDICAAANVGWIITENNQTAQNTIIREIVVQRDGESAAFWADAAGVAADVAGGGKPGGSKGTTKNSASHSPDVDGNLGGSGGVKGAGDIVVRSDDDFSATVNGNGKPKAHLNENGDLVPPNIDGTGSVQSHVRGGNAENSPYISVTDPSTTSNPKDYGTNKIEIDVKRLQQDIDSGVLPNTKFLTNQEVTTELQTKVDAARDKFTNNPTPKNQTSLDRAETDLASAARDGECLIKGCVPADYIKPVKK
ncbi:MULTISPECIES: DUF637 domain-containing protein [Pseudomonas]|nr:DUF637 domain-containing protein [Pseudomonas atacamensis]